MAQKKIRFDGKNEEGKTASVYVGVSGESLSMYDADVNTIMVNEHLRQDTGVTDTLSAPAAQDDWEITVVDGGLFAVDGRFVLSEDDNRETATIKIVTIVGNVLGMDKPLEYDYTTAAIVTSVIKSANVDGSVTRQVFEIMPPPSELWHIFRLTISMTHSSEPSDDRFGGTAKLTRGVVLRHENGVSNNLSVWRDNSDIIEDTGVDLRYAPKTASSDYGTAARWTFKRAGTVLHLDGSINDRFLAIVQDDLTEATTGTTDIEIKVQGHVELI